MSRFYKPSQTPLIDYSYNVPIEYINAGLQGRQMQYDKADAELAQLEALKASIQTLPDEVGGQYIGDKTAGKALASKYDSLVSDAVSKYDGDLSKISGELRKIKAEAAKDFGPNGVATALAGRLSEYSTELSKNKTRVEKGELNQGDEQYAFSNLKAFDDGQGGFNSSLGTEALVNRADLDALIPKFMKAAIKDRKDVKWSKSADGRYLIKNTVTGVTEQDLTESLNAYLESIPEYQSWKKRDTASIYNLLEKSPTDNPYYQFASDKLDEQKLNVHTKLEEIDKALENKKINESRKLELQKDKENYQSLLEKLNTYTDEDLIKKANDLVSQNYDDTNISPWMNRAGLSYEEEVKADPYYMENLKFQHNLSEIDYKAKKDKEALVNNIIATPSIITPSDKKQVDKIINDAKETNKNAKQEYIGASMKIYKELAKVNPELNKLLEEYQTLQSKTDVGSIKREKEIEGLIQKDVRGWMNDYNSGKDVGSYREILKENLSGFINVQDSYQSTLDNVDKAANAGEIQAQFISTPELNNKVNELRDFFKDAKNMPPELQKALASADNSKLIALINNGKLDAWENNYYKMGLPTTSDKSTSSGRPKGISNFQNLKLEINNEIKKATKAVEDNTAYNSNINFDLTQVDKKGYIAQANESLTNSVKEGFKGYQSWTGENMDDKVNKLGTVLERKLTVSTANYGASPLMTAYVKYKDKEGNIKEFNDYVIMDNQNMQLYGKVFETLATEEGKTGSLGRIVTAQNNLQEVNEGDFLEQSNIGDTFIIGRVPGANVQFKVLPITTATGLQYKVFMEGTDLEGNVLETTVVKNIYNGEDIMYDYNNIMDNIGAIIIQ